MKKKKDEKEEKQKDKKPKKDKKDKGKKDKKNKEKGQDAEEVVIVTKQRKNSYEVAEEEKVPAKGPDFVDKQSAREKTNSLTQDEIYKILDEQNIEEAMRVDAYILFNDAIKKGLDEEIKTVFKLFKKN